MERGHARLVIALIPARPDTNYWHTHVANRADIYFLRGRLRFDDKQSAPFPSAVVVWEADQSIAARLDEAFANAWKLSRPNR